MELRHLRYFVTLGETLHFAHAAEKLHIVQPALSMQIKALEEELGTQLFIRTRRKVELTTAGEMLLVEARRSLAHANRMTDLAEKANRGITGQLRLGFSAGAVYSGLLPALVRDLNAQAPEIDIRPIECHPRTTFTLLAEDETDAILGTLYTQDPPAEIGHISLRQDRPQLVLPLSHPLRRQKSIAPDQLKKEQFIGYAGPEDIDGMGMTERVLGYAPYASSKVSTPAMAIGLVAAGLGLAVIPSSVAKPASGVVYREINNCNERIDISLIWHKNRQSGAVERLIELAKKVGNPDA